MQRGKVKNGGLSGEQSKKKKIFIVKLFSSYSESSFLKIAEIYFSKESSQKLPFVFPTAQFSAIIPACNSCSNLFANSSCFVKMFIPLWTYLICSVFTMAVFLCLMCPNQKSENLVSLWKKIFEICYCLGRSSLVAQMIKNPPVWMKLESITQSEVSQEEKHQYGILTHIYGIQKDVNDDPVCETTKETQI